jgi:DNA-binding transcriptional MerR regulator
VQIGQLTRSAGVGGLIIRYYHRVGLLPELARPVRGSRSYGLEALDRLRFVRRAQQLGFSVAEICRRAAI